MSQIHFEAKKKLENLRTLRNLVPRIRKMKVKTKDLRHKCFDLQQLEVTQAEEIWPT